MSDKPKWPPEPDESEFVEPTPEQLAEMKAALGVGPTLRLPNRSRALAAARKFNDYNLSGHPEDRRIALLISRFDGLEGVTQEDTILLIERLQPPRSGEPRGRKSKAAEETRVAHQLLAELHRAPRITEIAARLAKQRGIAERSALRTLQRRRAGGILRKPN